MIESGFPTPTGSGDGHYALEAVPALTEALAGALLCLAHLAGAVDVSDEEVSPAAIEALRWSAPPVAELATDAESLLARLPERADAVATVTGARADIAQR